jgi:deazaflavin-dependent oxidoreductase (nitroreductase family)
MKGALSCRLSETDAPDGRAVIVSVAQALQRAYLRVHQALYKRSGGLIGHRLAGTPSLLLTTVGRRSGRPRTAALIYARDDADLVLVASNHGLDDPPAWFLNLGANPDVRVQIARRRADGHARVVPSGDPDYARLWRLVNDTNRRRYEGYQARTKRPIPLVVVTPSRSLT